MTAGMQFAFDYLSEHGDSPIDEIMNAASYVSPRQAKDGVYHWRGRIGD